MARTNLPVSKFIANSAIADPAGTAVDVANGLAIAGSAYKSSRRLYLRITSTFAGAKNVQVRAGFSPPAESAGQGDLVVAFAAAGTQWAGPLESARFSQRDGSVNIDFDAATTGTVTAFAAPDLF